MTENYLCFSDFGGIGLALTEPHQVLIKPYKFYNLKKPFVGKYSI